MNSKDLFINDFIKLQSNTIPKNSARLRSPSIEQIVEVAVGQTFLSDKAERARGWSPPAQANFVINHLRL
jgi:hypothetical protein